MRFRVAALVVLLVLAVLTTAGSSASAAEPLLPDLQQETPYALGIATDGRHFHLGFASVVYNYGDGPLRISGSRSSTRDPSMRADQLIDRDDGSSQRVEGIGRLRFVDAVTHRHWHYLKFDTYGLRRPDGTLARPDRKTGFCLGDRLSAPVAGPLPAKPEFGEYTGNCGFDSPDLLDVQEGISVGYGDDYGPQLEGQFVDITHLPAGRYALVHAVNADGALREKSLENNAASVLVDVRWRRGAPLVKQLARCPLSATCPVAPALTRERAERFARVAFRRAYGSSAGGVSCADPGGGAASCTGRVAGGDAAVEVRYAVAHGRLYWTWSTAAKSGRVPLSLGRSKRVPVERAVPVAARAAYCPLIASGSAASR
jgi:hypothetical protein